jgi:hypothetical protein
MNIDSTTDTSRRIASLDRRAALAASAASVVLFALSRGSFAAPPPTNSDPPGDLDQRQLEAAKQQLIRGLLYTRNDVDNWLAGKAFPFSKYDPELGYLHIDRQFAEGVDGSICTYRYDPSGARRTIAYADRPCRINTYGNSFTSCEQVSDGETWQEILAAHLGEPIRNFGIGGYSVYQAYLRMRREEQRLPAGLVVFNIFDDDHYRNLQGWQRPRFGANPKGFNPPVPHVAVDLASDTFAERPNPCPTPQSLYKLCDFDSAWAIFQSDDAVERFARRRALRASGAANVPDTDFDDPECTRRSLLATTRIIELVEKHAAQHNQRVLYVLSYGGDRVKRFIAHGQRFDASLVDFLNQRRLPHVDLLAAHAADFQKSSTDVDAYLARHFIGHYSPRGNFFCAYAIKDKLVSMLDPKPPAYGPPAGKF